MAPTAGSSSSKSSSRAVKIPHREGPAGRSSTSSSQRRRGRFNNFFEPSDASDAGPSSFSPESYGSSSSPSYSASPTAGAAVSSSSHASTRDPRLSSFSALSSSVEESYLPRTPSSSMKMKAKAVDELPPPNTLPPLFTSRSSPLGPSMLSSQTYKSINLNGPDPDEPPRLITYTKVGQGFTWNDELFLPSYMIGRYSRGRRKQYDGDIGDDEVEVTEIFITDEEAREMMP